MKLPLVVLVLAGCASEKPQPVPPKRPNTELIAGDYERRPTGPVYRFAADGTFLVAKTRAELDRTPRLAEGTYTLEGDQLVLHVEHGACEGAGNDATYAVVLSKIGARFTKVSDDCEVRNKLDGQTYWRMR